MTESWILFVIVAPIAGFLIARFSPETARRIAYLGLMIAPLAIFALFAALAPSGYDVPPGPSEWVGIGLFVIAPMYVFWAALVSIGFAAGRMSIH